MITFQNLILKLSEYWSSLGSCIVQPIDIEIGAATFHPITFFNSISNNNIFYNYIQLCKRPIDSKFNNKFSFKLQQYYQYQVILKPSLNNIQDMYINSLKYLGLDISKYEIKFIEDNWENPTLGAYGYGWEVWLNGLEITQFTYFQKIANINCLPVMVEIAYGLERLCLFLQNVFSISNLIWSDLNGKIIKYIDIFNNIELDKSKYNLYYSDNIFLLNCINNYEKESLRLLKLKNPLIFVSYEYALKLVNYFNLLDAKNYLSDIERKRYILKIRSLFCKIAKCSIRLNKFFF